MNITFFTGPGLNADLDLPTFQGRGVNSTEPEYTGVESIRMPTSEEFRADPWAAWEFWKELRQKAMEAKPSVAHQAIKVISEIPGYAVNEVTQNVGWGWHRLLSNANQHKAHFWELPITYKTVIELHGTLEQFHCSTCRTKHSLSMTDEKLVIPTLCRECENTGGNTGPGVIRPSVVMHKGKVNAILLDATLKYAKTCDVLVIVGASMRPYYLGEVIEQALKAGAEVIYIDPQASTSKNVFLALDYGLNAAERVTCIRAPADDVLRSLGVFLMQSLGKKITKVDMAGWAWDWAQKTKSKN